MKNDQSTGKEFTGMKRELLLPLLFDLVFPLGVYYSLRFLNVPAFIALIVAVIPTIIFQLHQIIKHKKADFLALFILGVIFLSVAASFITGSARFMLAKSGWFTGAIGMCFFVSLFLKKPIAYIIAKSLLERLALPENDLDALWETEPEFRRVWKVSTVIWGAGMLLNAVVLIYMAYAFPVDSVPFLASVLHGSTFLVLQVITNMYLRQQGTWKFIFEKKVT